MQEISLSEALRKGEQLKHNDGHTPVIAALKGMGALPENLDDPRSFEPGQHNNHAYSNEALCRARPWLKEEMPCPWCGEKLTGAAIVEHPIGKHSDEITFDDECDWIEEMEELDRSATLAVYFKGEYERSRVLHAAKNRGMTVTAFMASALRLIVEFGVPVEPLELIQ